MQNYERLLWVTEGFITHKRDLESLQKVAKDYQRIGLVPEGYTQAELHVSKQKPVNLQLVNEVLYGIK